MSVEGGPPQRCCPAARRIYGIELLKANAQLSPAKALVVENRATKTRRSMKLAG